jgi:hypothetical protein
VAAIKLGGMWGWINKSGDIVIAPALEEEEVGVFRSGMAMVVHNRKLGNYIYFEVGTPLVRDWCCDKR